MVAERCPECLGRKKVIITFFEATCPTCQGMGEINNPDSCTKCNGSKLMVTQMKLIADSDETIGVQVECDACNGTGSREAQEILLNRLAQAAGAQALADHEAGLTVPWEEIREQRNSN